MSCYLQIAQWVPCTQAEGPGQRCALWLQGCPLHCPGCCNPEMLPFDGGEPILVDALCDRIESAQRQEPIEGVTLLGGEPFAQAAAAAALLQRLQQSGLSVMIFTGYTLDEIRSRAVPHELRLLELTDLLVDGRYDHKRPDTSRRWIGSSNQQIHFLSDRYRPNDPYWSEPDTLEFRLDGTQLLINGFPAPRAKTVWQRMGST